MVKKIIDAVFTDMQGYNFADYHELNDINSIIFMIYTLLSSNDEFDLELKVRND